MKPGQNVHDKIKDTTIKNEILIVQKKILKKA